MKEELIAPCGMNCAVCSSFLAFTNNLRTKGLRLPYCTGCRQRGKICAFLKKRCTPLLQGKIKFCYECVNFPCDRLKHLDKRYRSLFRMSMIENAQLIQMRGFSAFLTHEEQKWRCPQCGDVICCHNGLCYNCQVDKLREKKPLFRWEG
jgi:hypothetical protein